MSIARVLVVALFSALVLGASLPAAAAPPRVIQIQVGDSMKFSVEAIIAKPGEELTVVLNDKGTMPKAAMGHNFVLLRKGADAKAFVEKSAGARDTEFIAPAVKGDVLAATRLLGPGETDQVTFTAPRQPGTYTYLCSFPGHYAMGMKGTLTVK